MARKVDNSPYVQRCLVLEILIKMGTNNPSQKSVVLESLFEAWFAWFDTRFKKH